MRPIYLIKNLIKNIGSEYRILVRSLRLNAGDKIAITGPSGCGKSTTLDMLGLSLRPDSSDEFLFAPDGEIRDIRTLWERGRHDELAALRRSSLGYVLQSGELLPYLSAGENMTLTARLAGMEKAEAEARAREIAVRLGIGDQWSAAPSSLSVGQRQRAAIARALCANPPVILADEPTAALDPESARRVMDALLDAIDTFGGSLALVTHNEAWAKSGGLVNLPFRLETEDNLTTAVLDDGGDSQ